MQSCCSAGGSPVASSRRPSIPRLTASRRCALKPETRIGSVAGVSCSASWAKRSAASSSESPLRRNVCRNAAVIVAANRDMPSPSTAVISMIASSEKPASRNSLVERAASKSASEKTRSSTPGSASPTSRRIRTSTSAGRPDLCSISRAVWVPPSVRSTGSSARRFSATATRSSCSVKPSAASNRSSLRRCSRSEPSRPASQCSSSKSTVSSCPMSDPFASIACSFSRALALRSRFPPS